MVVVVVVVILILFLFVGASERIFFVQCHVDVHAQDNIDGQGRYAAVQHDSVFAVGSKECLCHVRVKEKIHAHGNEK